MRVRRAAALLLAAVSALASARALGQDDPAPVDRGPDSDDRHVATVATTPTRLSETEVSASMAGRPPPAATHRDADVPAREAASPDLAQALSRLAGVHARSRGNFAQEAQVSVRGHGARANFGLRGIRLLVDGVPASSADGQGQLGPFEPWLYDGVELIAGPAALLYGNASGGVLRVRRRHLETWHSDIILGEHQQGLFMAGPWSRSVPASGSAQLSLTTWQGEGARPHSRARRSSLAVHGFHVATSDTEMNWQLSVSDAPMSEDPLGLTVAQFEVDPFAASPNALAFDTRKSSTQWQAALSASRDLGDRVDGLTAWGGRRRIEQFLAVPAAAQGNPRNGGGVIDLDRSFGGAEWTRSWKRERWSVSFGLRAELQRDARRGYENFIGDRVGVRGPLRRDEVLRVRSIDPVLSVESRLADGWTAFAGLRGTQLRFEVDDDYVAPGNPDDSGHRRFSAWSPAAGISWQRANWMFRASTGRGFESPTGNELAYRADGEGGLNQQLRAARSRLQEIGAAVDVDQVSLSATAFDERIRHEIVVAQSSGGRSVFRNAGRTRRRGLEIEADGRWGADWHWSATWTHLDARFLDGDAAGNRFPGVPQQWGAVRLAWLPAGAEGDEPGSRATEWWATLHRASGVHIDDDNTLRTGGWTRLDAGVSLSFATRFGMARLGLGVHNLLDRTYVGSVIVNESNGRYLETALPRSFDLSFSLSWP